MFVFRFFDFREVGSLGVDYTESKSDLKIQFLFVNLLF